jgi:cobalt/nickel transport system permease protein
MSMDVVETRTPDWLLRPELARSTGCRPGTRRRVSFVEKTVTGGANLLRQVLTGEDVAARRGVLQRLDARVKVVALLALLIGVGLLHHLPTLLAAYGSTLVLATRSGLPLRFFLKRVWLFVPVFTGLVVLPATLSIVTPGPVVLTLWHWHGTAHGLSAPGLTAGALVTARVATSVSLAVLLTLTTPWSRLLAGLRVLGVPRFFLLVVAMAYRYVFLLLGIVTERYEARQARTIARTRHDGTARHFLAASAGALFGKAGHLSEEVHQAMVARGYRGEARTLGAFRLRWVDGVAVLVAFAAAGGLVGGDVFLGR